MERNSNRYAEVKEEKKRDNTFNDILMYYPVWREAKDQKGVRERQTE